MAELLYLVHRIPYPPNKGDKIRSYHLLKHLAQSHRVHVGAFVDDPADWEHAERLKELAGGECCFLPLHSKWATVRSLQGFFSDEPLTFPYYRSRRMQAWVDALLARGNVRRALVYSSSMGQYLMKHPDLQRIIDFVDIDSDKWRQYAGTKPWPLNWVYRREADYLLASERNIARNFDAATFVSDAEAALFKQLAPESASKIFSYGNGVDTDYFSPDRAFENPYNADERPIVFTGAMDYWPNVDAVAWFACDVFRVLHDQIPNARFYIVGSKPTQEVRSLGSIPGVVVTGAVPDVRPYLAHAVLAVAPLRIARGIQNKVLEAMAMAMPTVVSEAALEGIDAKVGEEVYLARNPDEFKRHCLSLLANAGIAVRSARTRVIADFSWNQRLRALDRLFLAPAPSPTEGPVPLISPEEHHA